MTSALLTSCSTTTRSSRLIGQEFARMTSKSSESYPDTVLFYFRYDLQPYAILHLDPEDVESEIDFEPELEERGGRAMKSSINQKTEVIYKLEEPYPTECLNHGQLAEMTQKWYMCKSATKKSAEPFRVSVETYNRILSNYSGQYSCYTKNVVKNACVCPKGVIDYMCATPAYTKCYINVTSPKFYEGCSDREDTFQYLYSVPGFSPCWPQNFTESIQVEYKLKCQVLNENGLVSLNQDEGVGYPYRDVIKEATFNPYSYVSSNPAQAFTAIDPSQVKIKFEMRDMKYLSVSLPFENDAPLTKEILDGTEPGYVDIDLSMLLDSDERGESRYVVGGRTYFEASIFGQNYHSFTYKGFFDQAGYTEPPSTLKKITSNWYLWAGIGAAVLIAVVLVIYCTCCGEKGSSKKVDKSKQD